MPRPMIIIGAQSKPISRSRAQYSVNLPAHSFCVQMTPNRIVSFHGERTARAAGRRHGRAAKATQRNVSDSTTTSVESTARCCLLTTTRKSHVANNGVAKFAALNFFGAFHQSREVVGDSLGGN